MPGLPRKRRVVSAEPNYRHVSVALDEELARAVREYHRSTRMDGSVGETIRELVRIALAATPEDGAIRAARERAYNSVRTFVLNEIGDKFGEIRESMRALYPDGQEAA